MKMINYYLFVIAISIPYCQDNVGYRLIATTKDRYQTVDNIVENHFGPWDIHTNFSGRTDFDINEIDEKTGQITLIQSWNNVISTTRVDDEVTPNHLTQKMNGTSYLIVMNSDGTIASITPQDDKSQEMINMTESDNVGAMFSGGDQNLLYIFGSDSIRYVGDTWVVDSEIEEVNGKFGGFDFFEGTKTQRVVYSFKKIKEKKGDKIAFIKCESEILLHGVGTTWEKTIEFEQTLSGISNMQFNIDKGIFKIIKTSLSASGKGRDLDDDDVKSFNMNMNVKIKQKLK